MQSSTDSHGHQQNPLITPLYRLLRQSPTGLSEYQLLIGLQQQGYVFPQTEGLSANLVLFRKHFMVMNALYQLRDILFDEGLELKISALHIVLQERPRHRTAGQALATADRERALRDYYLDWTHFQHSCDDSVQALLNSFWQRFQAQDHYRQALDVLEVDVPEQEAQEIDWATIKQAYQRQAQRYHPDRGGDGKSFQTIRQAYETLALRYKPVRDPG